MRRNIRACGQELPESPHYYRPANRPRWLGALPTFTALMSSRVGAGALHIHSTVPEPILQLRLYFSELCVLFWGPQSGLWSALCNVCHRYTWLHLTHLHWGERAHVTHVCPDDLACK